LNWGEIQQQLIIRLTQTIYSFREVYLVTETATTNHWTLAIAGAEDAELEIATDQQNFGLVDIFGHETAKTIQSRDIEVHHREVGRKPSFFKAKKLVVRDDKVDVFISDLIAERQSQQDWVSGFFEYNFQSQMEVIPEVPLRTQAGVLDMLQSNQLNPNTALQYFNWTEANMDDIENFFLTYG
jgi:hypothetical protein